MAVLLLLIFVIFRLNVVGVSQRGRSLLGELGGEGLFATLLAHARLSCRTDRGL